MVKTLDNIEIMVNNKKEIKNKEKAMFNNKSRIAPPPKSK